MISKAALPRQIPAFIGHFGYEYQWWKVCLWFEVHFWATSGILLCQTWVRVRWRELLA